MAKEIGKVFSSLASKLREFAEKNGFSKAVLGLSGGIDSSVTACIAAEAFGKGNVLALALPSKFSSKESLEDARSVAKNLGIELREWPIEEAVELNRKSYFAVFGKALEGSADENPQARVRCNALMTVSNAQHRLLLATGNKTELALGYCTLYGDLAGGIAPIADLNKTEVYALGRFINKENGNPIPERVFEKKPSAELSPGQVDPFDYEKASVIVDLLFDEKKSVEEVVAKGFEEEEVMRLKKLIDASAFKRKQAPPAVRP